MVSIYAHIYQFNRYFDASVSSNPRLFTRGNLYALGNFLVNYVPFGVCHPRKHRSLVPISHILKLQAV